MKLSELLVFSDYMFTPINIGIYAIMAILLSFIMNQRIKKDSFDANEALVKDNFALALRRFGAHVALGIGMLGALSGKSNPNFLVDIQHSIGYGLMVVFFIQVTLVIIDKMVLPGINNNEEIRKGNTSVGIVEASMLIMTGLITLGATYGDNGGYISSVGFYILGQIAMICLVLIFEMSTKSSLIQNICEQENASSLYLAGKIIPYGMIMSAAIVIIESTDIIGATMEFGVYTAIGVFAFWISEYVIDKAILRKITITEMLDQNNQANALRLLGVKLSFSGMVAASLLY